MHHLDSQKHTVVNIDDTTSNLFVTTPLPLDIKMFTDSIEKFNTIPADAKWNGMLVWVDALSEWRIYNKEANLLEPMVSKPIVDKLLIFKHPQNTNKAALEVNDIVEGYWSDTLFIKAKYLGGSETELSSYDILEDIDFSS